MSARWSVAPLASLDDIDDILAVDHASFTNPWTREMYVADLQNVGVSFVFVAREAGGRIVGFCSFWKVLDELHINNLAVQPEYRRAGVARTLLTQVMAEANRLGARRAMLEVRRSNDAARQLYEGFGFTVLRVRPGYYITPAEDALVLGRDNLEAFA